MTTQGILFVAAGKKYIRAAMRAANTVRAHCPGLPIHLFANWRECGFVFDSSPDPFTSVGEIVNAHHRSKVDYLQFTPFERTLYLDSDTALNADIRDMFQVLDRFDIGLNHAILRNTAVRLRPWRLALPQAFPQFNGGVILYRKTPAVLRLLEDWSRSFKEAGLLQDQVTLRELLWLSDLRIATLPPEYNVRYMKYHWMWSKPEAETKIFHLRRFHDGPLWFVKAWLKRLFHALLRLGIDPRPWIGLKKDK